jgi:hypothetical protein
LWRFSSSAFDQSLTFPVAALSNTQTSSARSQNKDLKSRSSIIDQICYFACRFALTNNMYNTNNINSLVFAKMSTPQTFPTRIMVKNLASNEEGNGELADREPSSSLSSSRPTASVARPGNQYRLEEASMARKLRRIQRRVFLAHAEENENNSSHEYNTTSTTSSSSSFGSDDDDSLLWGSSRSSASSLTATF